MSESIEAQLGRVLNNYSDEIVKVLDDEAKKVAEETKKRIEQGAPKRTGKYSKSWRVTSENKLKGSTYIVHSPKHASRTHLLEKGHLIVAHGKVHGRTRAFPHIKPAEEYAIDTYQNRVSKRIEGL